MSHHLHHFYFKKMTKFEKFVTAVLVIEPITAIPQVLKIIRLESAVEFFVWRWVFGFTAAVLMVIYGIKIKRMPIIIASGLWAVIHGSMLIVILIYS